jgi:hypothetical protein
MSFMKTGLLCFALIAAPSAAEPAAASTIELRASPLVDLYYLVRAVADTAATAPELDGFGEAVAEARLMQAALGNPLRWGLIEGRLASCDNAAQAVETFGALPESVAAGGDRAVPLREGAVRLARSLAAIERQFMAQVWPRHEREIAAARERLGASLLPKQAECFRFIEESFGMQPLPQAIPVHLVAESPAPHGFTHRTRGGAVCFVGVRGTPAPLLAETVLHEATHALDVANKTSALADLGERLTTAGIAATDKRHRNAVHTLFFIQAAETVRRFVDPGHRDYGDEAGYYAKVRAAADVERPVWKAYLDGGITREEALTRIVAGLAQGAGAR